MSKVISLAVLLAVVSLLCGCASLKQKSFGAGGTVSAIKIEAAGSGATGMPLPNILMGGAAFAMATSPKDDPRPVYVRASRTGLISKVFQLGQDDSATVYIGVPGESAADTKIRLEAFTAADSERAALEAGRSMWDGMFEW